MSIIKRQSGSGKGSVTYSTCSDDEEWVVEMEKCPKIKHDVRKITLANLFCTSLILFLVCQLGSVLEIARNVSAISSASESGRRLLRCENVSHAEARDCRLDELECALIPGVSQRDAWMLVQAAKIQDNDSSDIQMLGCHYGGGRFRMLDEGFTLWIHNWRLGLNNPESNLPDPVHIYGDDGFAVGSHSMIHKLVTLCINRLIS